METADLTVTIAVPTYRRPEQLALLLDALTKRIAETEGALIDVLVVDNDPSCSARAVTAHGDLPVRYASEPTPGIAAVRNRALEECHDRDLVAFIDDDEVPRPRWLSSLLEVWREHRSSAVMGRVISVFDADVDPWVIASGTFARPPRQTGAALSVAAAGNLLLDVRQVRGLGVRFDPSLGLGGGEDTLFSRQLVLAGGTIVWCNESETEDMVVASRTTRAWVRQRAFSSANAWAHIRLRLADSRLHRAGLRLRFVSGGLGRILVGSARHLYGRARGDLVHDARGIRASWRGRGLVAAAFGYRYAEYARGRGQRASTLGVSARKDTDTSTG